MGSCSQCGSSVPDGQGICSMCYGDPGHGSDGYYQEWLETQAQEAEMRMAEEEWAAKMAGQEGADE